MALPQSGIFAVGTRAQQYLEVDLHPGVDPRCLIEVLASLRTPRTTVGGVNLVVGLSPTCWRHVAPDDTPPGVVDFVPIVGPDGFTMPATQHDGWVWVSAATADVVFDTARDAVHALRGVARVGDHTTGFTYHDSRDLSGFVDGTENPDLDEAADVALVPDGAPGAGSAIVLVQRWFHDLDALGELSVDEQQLVFGRTKPDSVELDDDVKPVDAHIARVVTHDEHGEEREIYRRSSPIGDFSAPGLEFVGFSGDQAIIDLMLHRMAGAEDGIRDQLSRFSTPVTGSYYVVPSIDALRRFAVPDQ
jgi:putative iron-dependent peroxidase